MKVIPNNDPDVYLVVCFMSDDGPPEMDVTYEPIHAWEVEHKEPTCGWHLLPVTMGFDRDFMQRAALQTEDETWLLGVYSKRHGGVVELDGSKSKTLDDFLRGALARLTHANPRF